MKNQYKLKNNKYPKPSYKTVIKSIMEKYAKPEMEAMRLFLNSETHNMLEISFYRKDD